MRKQVTIEERLTPCECCGYPLSQKHHFLEYIDYGETNYTIQLCANCHELYHLMLRKYTNKNNKKSEFILNTLSDRIHKNILLYLYRKVKERMELEAAIFSKIVEQLEVKYNAN